MHESMIAVGKRGCVVCTVHVRVSIIVRMRVVLERLRCVLSFRAHVLVAGCHVYIAVRAQVIRARRVLPIDVPIKRDCASQTLRSGAVSHRQGWMRRRTNGKGARNI